jgi:inner membrane protein
MPDLDTWLMLGFGIPRGSLFSHRGFFHSPFFLITFAAAMAIILARKHGRRPVAWLALMWAVSAVTHPLLDMLTNGGSGVMLLFPFSQERLFFPWRPIHVSPLSIARFFDRAGDILCGRNCLSPRRRWRSGPRDSRGEKAALVRSFDKTRTYGTI